MMKYEQLKSLPPEWPHDLTESIRHQLVESGRTIVVLDDDPTGTQTVFDVPVLTKYDVQILESVLREKPPVLFLLTNSRAMTTDQTKSFHADLAAQIQLASTQSGRQIELISRSDSTLRGHYPVETDVLAEYCPTQSELVLLMPFFLEGGRLTIEGQHFVREGEMLLPAHETPFAQDVVFGFTQSWMPKYVEEKLGDEFRQLKLS